MTSPRSGALLAAAVVVLAGCGGGGDAPAPTPTRPTAGLTIRVVDGDLGSPVPGASVAAVTPTGTVRAPTGADGTVVVPRATRMARVRLPGWSAAAANVAAGHTTVRIHDQRLQSPEYGATAQRTRFNPLVHAPMPRPATHAWGFDTKRLAEFPPAVKDGVVVVGNNAGRVFGIDARRGRMLWTQKRRGYIASSPAIGGRRAYITTMDGTFTAYRLTTGTRLWEYRTPGGSPIESSPLIIEDTAFFGAWDGRLYAVSLRTGRARWSVATYGAVKGGPARSGPNVVVGDYSGTLTAVNARSGRVAWRTDVGSRLYGGPAVSEGRIVVGDVGGAVVCVDARTGVVRWRHATGAYVYSSPAIARGTVFIGSYNGVFEALDLHTGAVRWSVPTGGRISGSATVVGDTVYTANLRPFRTWGLATADGAVRFRRNDGAYSPAVAAGRTLYLIGVHRIDAYRTPTR